MAAGTYIYCVIRSLRKPPAASAPEGLPGAARPGVLPVADGLWMVAAEVPLDRYAPSVVEASLRDLEWVSTIALAHEAVVEHFSRSRGAAVVPMKLFTIFTSQDRAVADVRARRRALAKVFERIEGCQEWGVRVMRGAPRRPAKKVAQPASGTAFLSARKHARDEARASVQAAIDAAEVAFASLAEIARDRRRRREDGATAGAAPLLDAAFLVPARRRARFHAAAARAARDVARTGGTMTLTGPWPPYNFVAAEDAR